MEENKIGYRVVRQGAPVVNGMNVICRHDDVVVVSFDLRSKYCKIGCYCSMYNGGKPGIPGFVIEANEFSLRLKKGKSIEDATEIEFTGLDGYNVFDDGGGRYNIDVCLVNYDKVKENSYGDH